MSRFPRKRIDHQKIKDADNAERREMLLRAEEKIKSIVGIEPHIFYRNQPDLKVIYEIQDLLIERRYILNCMCTYTPEEVERLEKINNLLLKLKKQMESRTSALYRTILRDGKDKSFDNDYNIEGKLMVWADYDSREGDYGSVLHLENDDYYGSDFAYMVYVITENIDRYPFCPREIDFCQILHSRMHSPNIADKEYHTCYEEHDDGITWDDSHRPELSHICMCYALHALESHLQCFSMPDILRINHYYVEAEMKCQRFADQDGGSY